MFTGCLRDVFVLFQVSHHPPMGSAHAENEHFSYDITSKLRTKFLGNSVDVYPVGRQVSWICRIFVLILYLVRNSGLRVLPALFLRCSYLGFYDVRTGHSVF